MTFDPATASPAEIDTALFPLYAQRWHLTSRLHDDRETLGASLFPGSIVHFSRHGARKVHGLSTYQLPALAKSIADTEDTLGQVEVAIAEFEVEFERRGGWNRYKLVGGGHLHRSWCSTLRWNTATYLFAEASGLDDGEVVAKYNYTACTKCFPDAPVAVKPSPESKGFCASSGSYNVKEARPGSLNLYRPFGTCKECGAQVSVTSTGKLRQHKTKEA